MRFIQKILIGVILIFPLFAFALDKSDCKIGKMVYIDNFLIDDEKVEIIDTYWGDKNEVKVKHSNGKEEWVALSDLQGDVGAFFEYIGKELLKEGMENIAEAKYQELQREKGYSIKVNNHCNENIKIVISYLPANSDKWLNKGWFSFEPYEESFLSSNGERLRTKNSILYYYAKSKTGEWSGSDTKEKINGEIVNMKKITRTGTGYKEITLTCSN